MHFHNGRICFQIFQIIINNTTVNMHVCFVIQHAENFRIGLFITCNIHVHTT